MKKSTIKVIKKFSDINDIVLISNGAMLTMSAVTKAPAKVINTLTGTFVVSLAAKFISAGIIFFGSEPKEVVIPDTDVEDLDQEFEDDLDDPTPEPEPEPESEPTSEPEYEPESEA